MSGHWRIKLCSCLFIDFFFYLVLIDFFGVYFKILFFGQINET